MEKVVLITGASSGIGLHTAKLFQIKNWKVAATMRKPETSSELDNIVDVEKIRLDVTDPGSIDEAVVIALEKFGRIDAVVNNAGFAVVGPFEAATQEQIERQIETNLYGSFYATRAIIPYMKQQGGGTIVNIGSRVGKIGVANIAPFSAAKFALAGFGQAIGAELRAYNIFVTTIFAGMINTDIYPLNPSEAFRRQLMTARDVADAVLWTCTLPPSLRVDELPLMPRQLDL